MNGKMKCACCGKIFDTVEARDICDICFYAVTNYNNNCFYESGEGWCLKMEMKHGSTKEEDEDDENIGKMCYEFDEEEYYDGWWD